jgi:hypothetical protein
VRERLQGAVIWSASLLLVAAFAHRLLTRGGPYFDRPRTVMDHVSPFGHETTDALVVLPEFANLLPRGASVACFRPVGGEAANDGNTLPAVGMLPRQMVVPPFAASLSTPTRELPDYVVALRDPFTHPQYELIAERPPGRLYRVRR